MQGEQPPMITPPNPPAIATMTSATSSLGSLGSLTSPTSSTLKTYNWVITPVDKMKYDALFDSLSPVNEKLPGLKVSSQVIIIS